MKFLLAISSVLALAQVAMAMPRTVVSVASPISRDNTAVVTVTFSEPVNLVLTQGVDLACTTASVLCAPVCLGCNPVAQGTNVGKVPWTRFTQVGTSGKQYQTTVTALGITTGINGASQSFDFSVAAGAATARTGGAANTAAGTKATVTILPGAFTAGLQCTDAARCPVGATVTTAPAATRMVVSFARPQVTPNANVLQRIEATTTSFVNAQVSAAPVFDLLYTPNQIYFTAGGKNGATLRVRVLDGAVRDQGGNFNAISNNANFVAVVHAFPQDCYYSPNTASAFSACACSGNNPTGTKTRTITPGAQNPPLNGGAACAPREARTETVSCSCSVVSTCGVAGGVNRCSETTKPATESCGCGPNCFKELGGCCPDVPTVCPASKPKCGSDVTCGAVALASNQKHLCDCSAYYGTSTSPLACNNFAAACGGSQAFCELAFKAVGASVTSTGGVAPSWCGTGRFGTQDVMANSPCKCDSGCRTRGDCCVDYTKICNTPALSVCGKSSNCEKPFVGNFDYDVKNTCYCGRNCQALLETAGGALSFFNSNFGVKCCTDYTNTCLIPVNLCKPAGANHCNTKPFSQVAPNRYCDCTATCKRGATVAINLPTGDAFANAVTDNNNVWQSGGQIGNCCRDISRCVAEDGLVLA